MPEAVLSRVMLSEPPFAGYAAAQGKLPWDVFAEWPARWLAFPGSTGFAFYRLVLKLDQPLKARIHVSADERYELYIDGHLQARGSERGDGSHWSFESFDLHLPAGRHVILARVWVLGDLAPWAQTTVCPGFLLAAEGEATTQLATGTARWEVRKDESIAWVNAAPEVGTGLGGGPGFIFDLAKIAPDWRAAASGVWANAEPGELPAGDASVFVRGGRHFLKPAMLRPQMNEPWKEAAVRYAAREDVFAAPLLPTGEHASDPNLQFGLAPVLKGQAFRVPAHTTIRAIIDLGDYVCQYPSLSLAGGAGALVRLRFAESLWDKADARSMEARDGIVGRVFRGLMDEIRPDGREHTVQIPWWRAGRFVQLEIKTAEAPLDLKGLTFTETRYPLGVEFRLSSNIPGLEAITRTAVRTLQMCSHETHMDCPYYEQLQYVGDTRLQVLLSFYLAPKTRLARKALVMFDSSRQNPTGLTLDSAPGEGKLIPPFSLWWVAMINDYARWRGERGEERFVRTFIPSAREIIGRFASLLDERNLLTSPRGWNYVDITPTFKIGVPPGGELGGHSAVLHLQMVYALIQMAELEESFGIKALGKHWRALADTMMAAAETHYWDAKRQLFADDLEHTTYSQHAQVFAVLSRLLKRDRAQALIARTVQEKEVAPCNIYFSHYLFEATALYDGGAYFRSRLADWQQLIDQGFKTFPETFSGTRSECHAWSAHVLYHILHTVVGVKPVGPGMARVRVEPNLQEGEQIQVAVAHPRGMIHLDLHMDKTLQGTILAPRGVEIEGAIGEVKVQIA